MNDLKPTLFGRRRPPRLDRIFQKYASPVYFVTLCTCARIPCLANNAIHETLKRFADKGMREKSIALGRYVIMPDHIHLFVRLSSGESLKQWGRQLKRALSAMLPRFEDSIWQRGFFDHLMRSGESYSEKWEYVRMNPVRAGLVANPEDWPFQGEIHRIEL